MLACCRSALILSLLGVRTQVTGCQTLFKPSIISEASPNCGQEPRSKVIQGQRVWHPGTSSRPQCPSHCLFPPCLPKSGILAITIPKPPSPRSCQAEAGLRKRPPGRNLGERPARQEEREKRRRVGNPSKVQGARDNWRGGDGQDPKRKRNTKGKRREKLEAAGAREPARAQGAGAGPRGRRPSCTPRHAPPGPRGAPRRPIWRAQNPRPRGLCQSTRA